MSFSLSYTSLGGVGCGDAAGCLPSDPFFDSLKVTAEARIGASP